MSGEISYPADLPISAHRDALLDAMRSSQVVVVAGETGSGKSTQLPKMLLELVDELGIAGWIGHTQPRRIAARSVCERIAQELGTEVGTTVGYTVRFNDRVGAETRIKLMTDGILLAEIQRDPQLSNYTALIIDEAHERSLNIDFLLGFLRTLLPERPDLKVIITSATIDTERFALHFADPSGEPAPIVTVSGRTYPVEIRYRPPVDDADQLDGIVAATRELMRVGSGDILVFLPGERDIRDATEVLEGSDLGPIEIVPLFARLSAAEQHRIFAPHRGRRVVLATNIAETSLTVPGIRYVIDPGLVRMSRYNQRTKVQRLPIEKVSRASADQRTGRCGRLGPGVCIRLYDEDDYDARPEFTDPEITRTSLASVILQMALIGLASDGPDDVVSFPFVDAPDTRTISDGIRLLDELGALDLEAKGRRWVTPLGRQLARLPVDPRIGRMIIAADEGNCLDPVLVIAAAMSIQDPREEPSEQREHARQMHQRFQHSTSDLLSYLLLWDYVNLQRRDRSSGSFRRMCRREFLNHNRLREWQDLYSQLKRVAKSLGFSKPVRRRADDVDEDAVHQAILTGLLSQIGMRDETDRDSDAKRRGRSSGRVRTEYIGTRNSRFVIAPGSALTKSSPRWVMAGELVETNRLYARNVAPLDPGWIEEAASHLATYSYSEPAWNQERGAATVVERATLYGLPIVKGRTINLDRVDPELARSLFIRGALVEREWAVPADSRLHQFLHHNDRVLAEAARWEAKTRNRSLDIEAEVLSDHYDRQLPAEVVSTRHFERWWKRVVDRDPTLLDLSVEQLLGEGTEPEAYPDKWPGSEAPLSYLFEPGAPVDGITVTLTVDQFLAGVAPYTWLVPGHRTELVVELLRTLPKSTRTRLAPLAQTAGEIFEAWPVWPRLEAPDICTALEAELAARGESVSGLSTRDLPPHLRPVFEIVDSSGRMLAAGRDPERLHQRVMGILRSLLSENPHPLTQRGLTDWPGGTIPRTAVFTHRTAKIEVFPALVDQRDSVDLVVLPDRREQYEAHWAGVRRLLRLQVKRPARMAVNLLGDAVVALNQLAASDTTAITPAGFVDDLVNATLDAVIDAAGGPPWSEVDMRALVRFSAARFEPELTAAVADVGQIPKLAVAVIDRLSALDDSPIDLSGAIADCRGVLGSLLYPNSLTAQGPGRFADVVRYLRALRHRVEQLPGDRERDLSNTARLQELEVRAEGSEDSEIPWMLQELRVSLWAQHLGTRGPISATRIRRRLTSGADG